MGDALFEDSRLLGRLESPGCCPPGRPGVPTASSGVISAYTGCGPALAQQTAELRKAIFPLRAWPAICQGQVYLAPRAC